MSAENKNLCKFDGQVYFCRARKWEYQKKCEYGLGSPHRNECFYYNCGMDDRCDNREANKKAWHEHNNL
jgi:hypothetical protein